MLAKYIPTLSNCHQKVIKNVYFVKNVSFETSTVYEIVISVYISVSHVQHKNYVIFYFQSTNRSSNISKILKTGKQISLGINIDYKLN